MSASNILFRDYTPINPKLLWTQFGVAILTFLLGLLGLLFFDPEMPFDLFYPIVGLMLILTSLAQLDQHLWHRFSPRVVLDRDGLKMKYHWYSRLFTINWDEIDHINFLGKSPLIITKRQKHISFHSMDYFNQIDLSKALQQKANELDIPLKNKDRAFRG